MAKKIMLGALSLLLLSAGAPALAGARPDIMVIPVRGAVNPPMAEMLRENIARAARENYHAVILELNTPGGLLTSTREIAESILTSPVPVIAFVSPAGAQCASAGTFIALACPVLAMSPGTNIGAAHPVTPMAEMDEVMKEKALSDTAAWITSLAERWGRNRNWAESAVRESVSANEREALKLGVCDLLADSMDDLLEKLDGREVVLEAGTVVLQTENAVLLRMRPGFRNRLLQAISDPNIAYILLLLGVLGIMAEFSTPGLGFPGVVGTICLLLAFYALATLPVTIAGIALIFLAVAFFVMEAHTPSFGLLGLGGLLALFLASVFLLRPFSYLGFSRASFYTASLFFALLAFGLASFAFGAQRRKIMTGREGMRGEVGRARTDLSPEGTVYVHGEYWTARTMGEPIRKGEPVRVRRVTGTVLEVEKEQN